MGIVLPVVLLKIDPAVSQNWAVTGNPAGGSFYSEAELEYLEPFGLFRK